MKVTKITDVEIKREMTPDPLVCGKNGELIHKRSGEAPDGGSRRTSGEEFFNLILETDANLAIRMPVCKEILERIQPMIDGIGPKAVEGLWNRIDPEIRVAVEKALNEFCDRYVLTMVL